MTDRIITREISAHHAWQGPESEAPRSSVDGIPTSSARIVYEPYPGAFDHLLGPETGNPMSGDLISQQIRQKLERFAECVDDGEDVDIGRDWIDALTTLGLLEKYRISPARWRMASAGEAYLRALSAQGQPVAPAVKVKPLIWTACEDDPDAVQADGYEVRYAGHQTLLSRYGVRMGAWDGVASARAEAAAQADHERRILSALEAAQ